MAKMLFLCSVFFVIGHQYRDITAYREFTERNPANWTVIAEYPAAHYKGMAYEVSFPVLNTVTGEHVTKMAEVIPCEPSGWYVTMRIKAAGYYNRGECLSFRGPRAYLVVEKGNPT